MALKDWKKTSDFVKKGTGSKGRYIRYSKHGSGDVIINEQDGTFLVTLESFDNSRRFNSKSQALAYAKSYMRNH